jgi:hypothetical protein
MKIDVFICTHSIMETILNSFKFMASENLGVHLFGKETASGKKTTIYPYYIVLSPINIDLSGDSQ